MTTSASWYALMTQIEVAGVARNCRAIVGRAMLATDESSTAMVMPSAMASIDQ